MILRDKILAQLHGKQDKFRDFDASLHDESRAYKEKLSELAKLSSAELRARLSSNKTPGALPTAPNIHARIS